MAFLEPFNHVGQLGKVVLDANTNSNHRNAELLVNPGYGPTCCTLLDLERTGYYDKGPVNVREMHRTYVSARDDCGRWQLPWIDAETTTQMIIPILRQELEKGKNPLCAGRKACRQVLVDYLFTIRLHSCDFVIRRAPVFDESDMLWLSVGSTNVVDFGVPVRICLRKPDLPHEGMLSPSILVLMELLVEILTKMEYTKEATELSSYVENFPLGVLESANTLLSIDSLTHGIRRERKVSFDCIELTPIT